MDHCWIFRRVIDSWWSVSRLRGLKGERSLSESVQDEILKSSAQQSVTWGGLEEALHVLSSPHLVCYKGEGLICCLVSKKGSPAEPSVTLFRKMEDVKKVKRDAWWDKTESNVSISLKFRGRNLYWSSLQHSIASTVLCNADKVESFPGTLKNMNIYHVCFDSLVCTFNNTFMDPVEREISNYGIYKSVLNLHLRYRLLMVTLESPRSHSAAPQVFLYSWQFE